MIADLRYLNSLMGYDAGRTQRFISVYKTEMPRLLDSLLIQIPAGNHDEVRKLAHSIKGQSSYIMAETVVKLALEIEERAGKKDDLQLLYARAEALQKAVEQVLEML